MNKAKNNNNNKKYDKLTNMKRVRLPGPCNQNGPKLKLKKRRKNKIKMKKNPTNYLLFSTASKLNSIQTTK